MDAEKLENAINEFLLCSSSLEYSINGYCSFETVRLSERSSTIQQTVQSQSTFSPRNSYIPNTNNAIVADVKARPRETRANDLKQININLSKFFSDDETVSITPNMLKKEFLHCKKCSLSNVKRVLSEGDIASSIAFVLTDTVPSEKERAYLDKVLSSIRLEIGKNAYLTSLVKCEGDIKDFDSAATSCKELLEKQLSLTSARGFIAFGKKASEYLKEVKKKEAFSLSAFIYSSSLAELETDKAQKEKLWVSFKKLVKFLNLPRV